MEKEKRVKLSDYTGWKNTPAGPTLQTDIGAFLVAKILEKTGNDKALKGLEKIWKLNDLIDDHVLAH